MQPMRIAGFVLSLAAASAVLAASPLPAAAGPLERMVTRYHGYIPACDSSWALGVIYWRFGYKERRFWGSPASLSEFGKVREIAYRPWGPSHIPRRYCRADVIVSGEHKTVVYYSIIEKAGFAGVGWGVEWCVVGYDRNLAYAPNCKMARP